MTRVAQGSPTKEFFVEMLTRDIDINDAILDLLDNCLDGVIRQNQKNSDKNTGAIYTDYRAKITIKKDEFIVEDNCGGIPIEIAEKYAFRMGRSPDMADDNLPTIGIYGIGMKRAIFKIGQSATVTTRHNDDCYEVHIPVDWVSQEQWDFEINMLENNSSLSFDGTRIVITRIHKGVQDNWNTEDKLSEFVKGLNRNIQQSYSFVLQKGFSITINDSPVTPLPMTLLVSEGKEKESIKPYLYKRNFNDVKVSIAMGFYAPPPSADEIDDENELKRSSADAGWTIVCNDRVVLYNDKSHLTGWGEAGIPQYHTQFIGIRGLVVFESNNPKNLPMTTTKRGIDTSSSIYAEVKNKMREALKIFTSYTNRWKGQNEKERKHSTAAIPVSIEKLVDPEENITSKYSLNFRQSQGAKIFSPKLPSPENDKPYRIIRFSRSNEQILDLVEHFFSDRAYQITPSQVGEKCFDELWKKYNEGRQ